MEGIELFFLIFLGVLLVYVVVMCNKSKEGYRDPIYIDKSSLDRWYEHSNGSIYGFPHRFGGDWDVLRGFPYYDRAY